MRVIIEPDYAAMSRRAAEFVARLIRHKPTCVLGLATGTTPLGMYQELARRHRDEGLDFSQVTTFNLDEYYGLPTTHPQSYHYFMQNQFFKHINVNPRRTHVLDGLTLDPAEHCTRYEQMIQDAGGIDLQVLGIGADGHIAFNEPGSSLGSRTRLKTLTEDTIRDNARFFDQPDDVPHFALTMGVGTILDSRQCLLIASGLRKAKVVAQAIEGPVTAWITASALQLHQQVITILDEAAACVLDRRVYYQHVERLQAEWESGHATRAAQRARGAEAPRGAGIEERG